MFIWPIVDPLWPLSLASPLALVREDGCYLLGSRTHSGHAYKHTLTHSKQSLTGRTWMRSKWAAIVSVQTMRFWQFEIVYACISSLFFFFLSKCMCGERARDGAKGGQEIKGWETARSFSIRAHKLNWGWGITVSEWAHCLRWLQRATCPISHAANILWRWTYVPLIVKSIEMSYRPAQAVTVLMFSIQMHYSFAQPIHSMTFIIWVKLIYT